MARAIQKVFQVISEGEALIVNKKFTDIQFDEKMANKSGEGFLLTTNFYKSPNNTTTPPPEEWNK